MRNRTLPGEHQNQNAMEEAYHQGHSDGVLYFLTSAFYYIILPVGFLWAGWHLHGTNAIERIQPVIKSNVVALGEKLVATQDPQPPESEVVSPAVVMDDSSIHDHLAGYALPKFSREDILTDKYERLPSVFNVPESLYHRVGFWFDIYTKYSSQYEVLHHRDYPWIVFEVLDLRRFQKGNEHRWTRYHKAKKYVSREKRRIRHLLRKLSKRRNFRKLTETEKRYVELIKSIPGKGTRKKLKLAAKALRGQVGQKDYYVKGLKVSGRYLSQMEQTFAQYDLPVELTRLPLVESSFNLKAVSKVGASGVWQFMPRVGKKLMKVDGTFDERNSPLKATDAAARLLLENFRILKSWPLAVTAYNHGPGGVRKAARHARSRELGTIIKRYSSRTFGFASKNFYAEFLAALLAERYQDVIFGEIEKGQPLLTDEIRLTRSLRIREAAAVSGMTLEEVKLYNEDLKTKYLDRNLLLPRGYNFHLPRGRRHLLANYLRDLSQQQVSRVKYARVEPKRDTARQNSRAN